jgi:D-alanine-D-alanine ligase
MKKPYRITVMMDAAYIPAPDPEFKGTPAEKNAEYNVIQTLRKIGHQVQLLGVSDNIEKLVKHLTENRPDLVFNLTEQFRSDRRMDKNIVGLLELFDIPYTGTGPAGLFLSRNKALSKQLLSSRKIHVPGYVELQPGKVIRVPKSLRYPLIIKPIYEDGSEGIHNASLVKNTEELADRVKMVHEKFQQSAIAEEYVEGREFYISLLGNHRLTLLPPRELSFGSAENGGPVLATYRVKWNTKYRDKWGIKFNFVRLDEAVWKSIARVSKKVYRLCQMHDYGRIDLRLTPANQIVILEVNPNPNIAADDELAESARKAGISYRDLIDRIIRLCLKRNTEQGV